MSWDNGRISYSYLNWWRKCPKAFNHYMSKDEGEMNPFIEKGAKFGILTEKLWDQIIGENWFVHPHEEVEIKLLDVLKTYQTEDAYKIKERFFRSYDLIKGLIGTDYKVSLQESVSFSSGKFTSYGRLDYVLDLNGKMVIVDAKASSARNKDYPNQLLHYGFLWHKKHYIVPDIYVFYTRKGWLDRVAFNQETSERYERAYEKELLAIQEETEFPAIVGNHCFMCSFANTCEAKRMHDIEKSQNRYPTFENGDLMI